MLFSDVEHMEKLENAFGAICAQFVEVLFLMLHQKNGFAVF